jgi:hypothetical protein
MNMNDASTFLDSLFMPEKNEVQIVDGRSIILNAELHLEWDLLAATYEYERGLTRSQAERKAMNEIARLIKVECKPKSNT